ncbi:MAG TPA: preprotein translocase subunit YajC [Clostridia bacterium]|nr:preprotein translocase subunit YajC [Clostridia bacterium]
MPQGTTSTLTDFFTNNGSMIIIVVMMVVLFAVMIIPQRRRDKKIKDMLAAIKPGDRVRTIGGIYGTVTSIKDDIVTISVGPDKVRLVFARGAIANVEDSPVENTLEDGVK